MINLKTRKNVQQQNINSVNSIQFVIFLQNNIIDLIERIQVNISADLTKGIS